MINRLRASALLFLALPFVSAYGQPRTPVKKDTIRIVVPPSARYQNGVRSASLGSNDSLIVNVFAETRNYPKSVNLYATVLDTAGNFIADMAPPFVSTEVMRDHWKSIVEKTAEGREEKIERFSVMEYREGSAPPFAASLVLDYSGSMSGDIHSLERAVEATIGERRKEDKIAIVKFDNVEKVEQKLTSDSINSGSILRGMNGYGGATALYDACLTGIAELKDAGKHSRILIVFTDGNDNSSLFSTASDVVQAARASDVTIFTIAFSGANSYVLEYMASETGGRFYSATSSSSFESILREIFQLNKVYYKISYTPPADKGERFVTVGMNGGNGNTVGTTSYNREWKMNDVMSDSPKLLALFPFEKHKRFIVSEGTMTRLVTYLRAHPEMAVVLQGHTDSEGDRQYNRILSARRAAEIAQELRKRGIPRRQMIVEGYGEDRLLNRPDYPSRLLALENRRVEVKFVPRKTGVSRKRGTSARR